ncbi:hypothetical protein B0H21DRAFT_895350 [Amylocystis lapponica]|nr:hypothetical protein B0H21DRAFT_895350 [Amylocystis lapponica]
MSSSSSSTATAIGVSFALVVLLALCSLAFWLVRRRRRQRPEPSSATITAFRRDTFVALNHPASRVTPFNSPGRDCPRFVHQPGENMRVAHRRSDGGWEFSDVIPDNTSTIDLIAHRPSLDARSTFSLSHKDKLPPGVLTTRGFLERDADDCPPPAYAHEPDGRSVSAV